MKDNIPLSLEGELTIYNAAETKSRLMDALGRSEALDVDLSNVTEFDTAGLQLVMLAKREAERAGKALHYVNCSPMAREVFEFFNLDGQLGIPESDHSPED